MYGVEDEGNNPNGAVDMIMRGDIEVLEFLSSGGYRFYQGNGRDRCKIFTIQYMDR